MTRSHVRHNCFKWDRTRSYVTHMCTCTPIPESVLTCVRHDSVTCATGLLHMGHTRVMYVRTSILTLKRVFKCVERLGRTCDMTV